MRLPGPNLNLDRTSVRFNRFRFRTSVQNRTSASLTQPIEKALMLFCYRLALGRETVFTSLRDKFPSAFLGCGSDQTQSSYLYWRLYNLAVRCLSTSHNIVRPCQKFITLRDKSSFTARWY